jgi:hypothetical protein
MLWLTFAVVVCVVCVYAVHLDQRDARRENARRWGHIRRMDGSPLWPDDFVLRDGKPVLRD